MQINIKITSNSKVSTVAKVEGNNYNVKVDAPAVEGRANKRLIEILSEYFHIPKSSVRILKGAKSRNKIVELNV